MPRYRLGGLFDDYSRPIDPCVAFDLETPRCHRRQLRNRSEFGDVVITPNEIDNLCFDHAAFGYGFELAGEMG